MSVNHCLIKFRLLNVPRSLVKIRPSNIQEHSQQSHFLYQAINNEHTQTTPKS